MRAKKDDTPAAKIITDIAIRKGLAQIAISKLAYGSARLEPGTYRVKATIELEAGIVVGQALDYENKITSGREQVVGPCKLRITKTRASHQPPKHILKPRRPWVPTHILQPTHAGGRERGVMLLKSGHAYTAYEWRYRKQARVFCIDGKWMEMEDQVPGEKKCSLWKEAKPQGCVRIGNSWDGKWIDLSRLSEFESRITVRKPTEKEKLHTEDDE